MEKVEMNNEKITHSDECICDFCGHTMKDNMVTYKVDEESRKSKMMIGVEKLGYYYREIVAKFSSEKLSQDVPRELLRIEEGMEGILNPFQISIMEKRILQIKNICSKFNCRHEAFMLRVEQMLEIVELKKKQWAYSLSSNLA